MFTSSIATIVRHLLVSTAMLSAAGASAAAGIADPLGTAVAASATAREIKLGVSTRVVNVSRHEVVRFVNAAGQSFTWQFSTLNHPIIELGKIAPANFSERAIPVYVGQSPDESR